MASSQQGWIPLIFALCLTSTLTSAEVREAELSTEELRARLKQMHADIRSWQIEYQASDAGIPFYNHRILALTFPDGCFYHGAKGPRDFDSTSEHIDSRWKDDAFQDWLLVTSTHCHWGMPISREYGEYRLPRDAALPTKMYRELMFSALGWWPFEKRPGPRIEGGGACVIPEIVELPGYVVAARQELCDGCWCHVLELPGVDRLWLDCQRNCAILAREMYDVKTGTLVNRLEMQNHDEVWPGIWAPREIRNIHFEYHPETPRDALRPILNGRIKIIDVRLNEDVDASIFDRKPLPPGALQTAEDGTYRQAVAGGFEHMDNLVGWMERTRRFANFQRPSTEFRRDYVAMVVATAIILMLTRWRTAGDRARVG